MTARSTYEATNAGNNVAGSATNARDFAGVAGNVSNGLIPNNTQQFPSIQAIESAFALGSITQAQRVALRQATIMNFQETVSAAKSVLRDSGDKAPA